MLACYPFFSQRVCLQYIINNHVFSVMWALIDGTALLTSGPVTEPVTEPITEPITEAITEPERKIP